MNAMIQKDVSVNFIISIGININNAKKAIITINIFNFFLKCKSLWYDKSAYELLVFF